MKGAKKLTGGQLGFLGAILAACIGLIPVLISTCKPATSDSSGEFTLVPFIEGFAWILAPSENLSASARTPNGDPHGTLPHAPEVEITTAS